MLALTLALLTASSADVGTRSARLLDDAPLVAQADAPPMVPLEQSEAQVSAAQLQVDLDALKKQRPGLGGPITLVALGGGLALTGGLYVLLGATSGGAVSAFSSLMFVGIGALAVGVPMAVIGVWMLVNRLQDRAAIDAESARLRKQLEQQRTRERYAPPLPSAAAVADGLLLARF